MTSKRLQAQLEKFAARLAREDDPLDEEEDEAQPEQETIPQGGSSWPSWLKWGIFLLVVLVVVWYLFLSPTGQAEEVQQEKGQIPEPQKPEPPPQSSPRTEPSRNGTFTPSDQSAAPFSLPVEPPNETFPTTQIWPTESW